MFCRNRESGLVNSFMVFSILLHNQRIKEKISINLLVLNSWSIEKGTSGVCMGEGVRAHPSHPPSLQACLVVGKYTFFHGFAIQCGVLGGGGDFTRGSRPLLEDWVQIACSPYCPCGKPNDKSMVWCDKDEGCSFKYFHY